MLALLNFQIVLLLHTFKYKYRFAFQNFQIYIHFCFLQYSIGFHVRKKQIITTAHNCTYITLLQYKYFFENTIAQLLYYNLIPQKGNQGNRK